MKRSKLSDILQNDDRDRLSQAWTTTEAADDFKPLPAGEYVADIVRGELISSRTNNTPGYQLTFEVTDSEYAGRRFWHDMWLTPAALPMAKRDLAKLGIQELEQLEQPLPAILRCRVKLALRRSDDGAEYNRVRSFEVMEIVDCDAFAPGREVAGLVAEGSDDAASPPHTNRLSQLASPNPLNGQPSAEEVS